MNDVSRFSDQPTRQSVQTLEAVRNAAGVFDADAWHVMDQRDNEMIRQELLFGAGSSKYVYRFPISNKEVTGISVIGARQLASMYGGIKHRLIASVTKIGSLFTFTSYPAPGIPMHVEAQLIDMLAGEDDFYEVVIEIDDIKTGNSLQVRKRESRLESRQDGSKYERPHYSVIAESKAFRNGVLALIDQGTQLEWKTKMLALHKDDVITESVIDEKRTLVLRFAASKSVPISRIGLESLTIDQLAGLGDAARAGGVEQFRAACEALSVMDRPRIVDQKMPGAAGAASGAATGAAQAGGAVTGKKANAPKPSADKAPDKPKDEKAAPPADEGAKPADQPTPPAFEAWVADEDGALASNENGSEEHYMVPAAFLGAMSARALASANAAVLLENNEDSINQARHLDPAAAAIFDKEIGPLFRKAPEAPQEAAKVAEPAPAPEPETDPTALLAMPNKGGRPDLVEYVAQVKKVAQRLTTHALRTAWHTNNLPTIKNLPTVTKRNITKILTDAEEASNATKPAETDEERTLRLRGIRDDLVKEIGGYKTLGELDEWSNMANVQARFRQLPEDMRKLVQDASVDRQKKIKEGAA
jgi:hypothetical protein